MNIITLTLNPCIDVTLWADEIGGEILRTDMQTGGKGINVSRVLANLGMESLAICPVGGESGARFLELARAEGIKALGVAVSSPTRTIKTHVRRRDYAQKVDYARGGALTGAELDALEAALFENLPGAQVLAICGSASCDEAAQRVPDIIRRARNMGVKVLLDSNGPALICGSSALPDLIKPNEDELFALTGIKDDVSAAANMLIQKGVGGVLASMGNVGCMLATYESEEYCPAPKVDTVNAVGSGDSFVAGFLYGAVMGYDTRACLSIACAAGAANAAMFPAARITKDDVEKLLGWKLA
jgi:1-phosphofructokinase family hexose kinase